MPPPMGEVARLRDGEGKVWKHPHKQSFTLPYAFQMPFCHVNTTTKSSAKSRCLFPTENLVKYTRKMLNKGSM